MFSETILSLFNAPQNLAVLPEADAIGQAGEPGQGPYMTVYLRFSGDRIEEAAYQTYGCPGMIACGSWLTSWVKGKTREQAGVIEPADLALVLGGLPLGKEHCPELAVRALRAAVQAAGGKGGQL